MRTFSVCARRVAGGELADQALIDVGHAPEDVPRGQQSVDDDRIAGRGPWAFKLGSPTNGIRIGRCVRFRS